MTDLRQAAQQALEALQVAVTPLQKDRQEVLRAQAALRTALEEAERRRTEFSEATQRNKDHAEWYLKTHPQQAKPSQEPFGYFRAEPFGWTDCAETDEGAVALYEQPDQRKPLTCLWSPEDDDVMPGTYRSACGELWSFIDGGWKDNRVRYCHGCGGKVIEASSGIQEPKP